MNLMSIFKMPKPVNITGRSSSITNAFVNGIIPCVIPTEQELAEALSILELDAKDLRCAYCGDKCTEWDHLRPLVKDQRPTGYISEIHNLIPSCGKCNQSKGNKYWKDWIMSDADLSPKTKRIPGLEDKVRRLERYEKWKEVKPVNFEAIVGKEVWEQHWKNHELILKSMKEYQNIANKIKVSIQENYINE